MLDTDDVPTGIRQQSQILTTDFPRIRSLAGPWSLVRRLLVVGALYGFEQGSKFDRSNRPR